jgi:hypothetical protein
MLEELQSFKLGPVRHLREPEMALVARLLEKAGNPAQLLNHLDALSVQEMSDGGMGSLYFANTTKTPDERRFGERIAELQFDDVDGVSVLVSLNVDKDGDLFELDVWKTDFKPDAQNNLPRVSLLRESAQHAGLQTAPPRQD